MSESVAPWPPAALRSDALGQLYNEAYERAACQEGDSAEDAHQAACAAVLRHGYDHAKGIPEARIGHGDDPCTCTDARCVSVLTRLNPRGDGYLDSVLARPGMYAGPSVQTLELVLLNLLSFRCVLLDVDVDPRAILRQTYLGRFGHSCGSAGPAPRLIEHYGNTFSEPVLDFYGAFLDAVRAEIIDEQRQPGTVGHEKAGGRDQ